MPYRALAVQHFSKWKLASSVSDILWLCVRTLFDTLHLHLSFVHTFSLHAHELGLYFYSFFYLVDATNQPLTPTREIVHCQIGKFIEDTLQVTGVNLPYARTPNRAQCLKLEFMNCWKSNHIQRYEDILLMWFSLLYICPVPRFPLRIRDKNVLHCGRTEN